MDHDDDIERGKNVWAFYEIEESSFGFESARYAHRENKEGEEAF